MKTRNILWTLILSLALLAGALVGPMMLDQVLAQGEPGPGTVENIGTYTFHAENTYTDTATIYSASPYGGGVAGLDLTMVEEWHQADIFVTVDITGTSSVTVTPQFSPDQTNWADAQFRYVADSLAQTTTIITSTGEVTTTVSGTSAPAEQDYQVVLTADGTDYERVPIAGRYMRLKIERSGDGAEVDIRATLRNNGGQ